MGGVYVMRDKRDADLLAEAMLPGRRLLIIGGGYIGLEAAAVGGSRGAGSGCSTHVDDGRHTPAGYCPPPSRGLSCRAHNTATLPRVCLVQANEAGSAFVHVAWHCSVTRVMASQCSGTKMGRIGRWSRWRVFM